METKVWVLTGVILVLGTVLWWIVRLGIKGVYARLDQMIVQNAETAKVLVKQSVEIEHMEERIDVDGKRLNGLTRRVRNLEIKK